MGNVQAIAGYTLAITTIHCVKHITTCKGYQHYRMLVSTIGDLHGQLSPWNITCAIADYVLYQYIFSSYTHFVFPSSCSSVVYICYSLQERGSSALTPHITP